MQIEMEWLRREIVRIVHRKLHTRDDQNGKCVEAAEDIMALLPADDEAIASKAEVLALEDRIRQLELQNDSLISANEKYAGRKPGFYRPVPGSDKAV